MLHTRPSRTPRDISAREHGLMLEVSRLRALCREHGIDPDLDAAWREASTVTALPSAPVAGGDPLLRPTRKGGPAASPRDRTTHPPKDAA